MPRYLRRAGLSAGVSMFTMVVPLAAQADAAALGPALSSITAEALLARTQDLADDSMRGRAPGGIGEERAVRYLVDAFQELGLAPGNPDGTYTQDVPLVGISSRTEAHFDVGGERIELSHPENLTAWSKHVTPDVRVEDSDLVFVGYGVVAPEYGWDDFKGVDVRGKTLVMLVNDPAVADASDPTQLDTAMFRGEAMTYYGRWSYKYEIAGEQGAAAAIVVHETGPAGYPWDVVTGSWGRENFDIVAEDDNLSRVPVESWITRELAQRLFSAAGHDFDELKQRALSRDFQPVPLEATASFTIEQQIRRLASKNVVASVPGRTLPNEYIVYTAHWDHLGVDPALEDDSVYNGALDNASGTAALLEIAEAFTRLDPAPQRSILFLAVTAEEQGLLGAKYYAQAPLYPLERTLANINIDGVNQWGRTEDVVVIGHGSSTLDEVLAAAAAAQGRRLVPDPEPEKGFYYRSDHFEFAKQGVPALYTDSGTEYIGRPPGYGDRKREEYTANDYHKPSDEVKPDWDLSGAVEDARLLFRVGYEVSEADRWPEWNEGTEFKAIREASVGEAVRK
ncbi:MAG: M28 family metallopeptidase [Longimicrobiales bacterium]